jgi:hypothetical protein
MIRPLVTLRFKWHLVQAKDKLSSLFLQCISDKKINLQT